MSDQKPSAYIYGAAVSNSWADASKSLTDLIFDGVSAALADAGVEMADVDSVVLAAHDLIDGRSLSSMVTAPAAGAYLRDEIRLADDGLAAMSLAAARVTSGESKLSVVAAWGRASEGDFLNTSRAAMDPFMQQPFGISEFDVSAFRLSRWLGEFPGRHGERERALEARLIRAKNNPRAVVGTTTSIPVNYPLRQHEGPAWADVVTAVIVGERPHPIRIAGIGHGTDMTEIGDRDLLGMAALRAATAAACREADRRLADIDIVEIDGMMLSDEALAIEALGMCEPGQGFAAYASSDRINPSGGAAAGWCYPAMGLVRLAECYFHLTGRGVGAPNHKKSGSALAVGASPVGGQTRTAMILEA